MLSRGFILGLLFFGSTGALYPSGWNISGATSSYSGVCAENYISGKTSYFFSSNNTKSIKYLEQTVDLCNCELDGNILVASAWAKEIENTSETTSAKFRIVLTVTYEDGSVDEYTENFDHSCSGWQYAAIPFVLRNECYPMSVTMKLDYSYSKGTCYFTNARLVAVNGIVTTNSYSTGDNIIAGVMVFGESKDIKMMTTKYDGVLTTTDYIGRNSDIVRTMVIDKDSNNFTTQYKYDSNHNIIKMQDYRGMVIEYEYNAEGKKTSQKTYHKDTPSAYMYSEYTYKDNFTTSESDARYLYNGEKLKTEYEYDTSRGIMLKQTDVNGQEYHYTYDDNTDDLKSLYSTVNNKTSENQFYYTKGYLTRVAHNGFNFGFAFDKLGRSKSITVGEGTNKTTLLSTEYTKSGVNDIVETTYASGEKNTVITNMFGNPISSTYTDKNGTAVDATNLTYDSTGKITQMVDNMRGICYTYKYNAKGDITQITETDSTSKAFLALNLFSFDENERLASKYYGSVGHTYFPIYEKNSAGYIYPDNEVIGITLYGKFTDKVTKDGLRRAKNKTFSIGSRTLFSESYSYLTSAKANDTIETEIVSSVTSQVYGTNANTSTLNYTYDKAGNLETVRNGTTLVSKYYYDGLNRLVREDNYTAGKTYVWEYDVGGNITAKKTYALTADINLGNSTSTITYTYKTSGWKDQLVSYKRILSR